MHGHDMYIPTFPVRWDPLHLINLMIKPTVKVLWWWNCTWNIIILRIQWTGASKLSTWWTLPEKKVEIRVVHNFRCRWRLNCAWLYSLRVRILSRKMHCQKPLCSALSMLSDSPTIEPHLLCHQHFPRVYHKESSLRECWTDLGIV